MSEATGRCSPECGWFEFGADGDLCWKHWGEDGSWEDAAIGSACPKCGYKLLEHGNTATGRCGCGYCKFGKWSGDEDDFMEWDPCDSTPPDYEGWVFDEHVLKAMRDVHGDKPIFCPGCGHQLLAEGRTLAPATEEERRDAKAMEAIRTSVLGVENFAELVGMDAVCTGAPKHPWVVTAAYITKPGGGAMEWQAEDPVDAIEACVAWLNDNVKA